MLSNIFYDAKANIKGGMKSQPSGNSGVKIACGKIEK